MRSYVQGVPYRATIILIVTSLLVLYYLWSILVVLLISAFLASIQHLSVEQFDRFPPRILSILLPYVLLAVVLVVAWLATPLISPTLTPKASVAAEDDTDVLLRPGFGRHACAEATQAKRRIVRCRMLVPPIDLTEVR